MAQRPTLGNALGPVRDKGHTDAARHRCALVKAVGRVGDLCPTAGIGHVGVFAANAISVKQPAYYSRVFRKSLAPVLQVKHTGWTANRVSAVVRSDEDQRVVNLAGSLQELQQLSDVLVHIVDQPRIHLHVARKKLALLCGQFVPGRDARVARWQLGVRLDQAHRLLPLIACQADGIPAGVVAPTVFCLVSRLGL